MPCKSGVPMVPILNRGTIINLTPSPSPCQLAGIKIHKHTKRKGTDDGWLLGR